MPFKVFLVSYRFQSSTIKTNGLPVEYIKRKVSESHWTSVAHLTGGEVFLNIQKLRSTILRMTIIMMLFTTLMPARISHAAPTVLSPGDIAVVAINAKDTFPTQRWAFVILNTISSSTVIHFTDAGIFSTGNFSTDATSDGHMTWTVPTDLAAGKLFVVTNNSGGNATIVDSTGTSYSGINGSLGGSTTGFSVNGDQIFVYQGTRGSTRGATFIYGFNNANGSEYITNGNWIVSGTIGADRLSYAPSSAPAKALNALTSNLSGSPQGVYGTRNLKYIGPKMGTQDTLLAAMKNTSNWTYNHVTPYNDFNSIGNFTVTSNEVAYYTVTYNGNGNTSGTAPTDATSYLSGATVTALSNTGSLTKTDFTFAGWNTAADGTGTDYAPTSSLTIGSSNVTLYAKWTLIPKYSITYNGNGNTGGTVPVDSSTYAATTKVNVLGNTGNLVKEGYTFQGWNVTRNEFSTNYQPLSQYTMPTNNVTLYAKWKPDSTERLVIQSGFESNVSVVTDASAQTGTFAGADDPSSTFNWDNLNGDLYYSNYYRDPSLSTYSIVADPLNPTNKVAKFTVVNYGADPGHTTLNGRAQGSFSMGKKIGRNEIYNTLHVKYRQYVSPDYEALKNIPFDTSDGLLKWTDLFEIWTPPAPSDIRSTLNTTNDAGSFRINFEFEPNYDLNLNGGFTWHLRGEDMEFKTVDGHQQWVDNNSSVAVPFGKWVDWDVYIVKGADPKIDATSSARVVVKMRVVGEQDWVTLFNETNERTEHSWIPNEGYYQAGIFKNYLGPGTVKYLKDVGKQDISLYFDDLSFWVDTAVPAPQRDVLADVIVDNADPSPSVIKSGSWTTSASTTYRYGADFLVSYPNAPGSYVKYTPTLPASGRYRVFMKNVPYSGNGDKVKVDVVHAAGTTTVNVNQKYESTLELGEYTFQQGTAGSVTIRNDGVRVGADAIEFQLITPLVAPSVTAPTTYDVTKEQVSPLTNVLVTGNDAELATITLMVPSGTLNAVAGSGVTVLGAGTNTLVMTGKLADLKDALAANRVVYTSADAYENVTLTINCTNAGMASNVALVTIRVGPIAPTVSGIEAGATYSAAVTASWADLAQCTSAATLSWNGGEAQPYTKNTAITANGEYELRVNRSSTVSGLTATTTVHFTINVIKVDSIRLSPTSLDMVVGGASVTLNPQVLPDNATNKEVTWSSDNSAVATVTSEGVVYAISEGTATITATTIDGSKPAQVIVHVTVPVSEISFTETKRTMIVGDADITLAPHFMPTNASNKNLAWRSSNADVVTVSNQGVVHAVARGTATITAITEDGSKPATVIFTVMPPAPILVSKIIVPDSLTIQTGKSAKLTATVQPNNPSNAAIVWSSSASAIAKVDSTSGNVTGIAPGTVTITAASADGNARTFTTVTVIRPVDAVVISPSSLTMKLGDKDVTLTATVKPADASNPKVSWSSSDDLVAKVNQQGVVHAVGLSTSSVATITATTVDGKKIATCKVTVIIPVKSLTLPKNLTATYGKLLTLKPLLAPANATITWASSKKSIATVNEKTGVVTPIAAGTVTITATSADGKISASTIIKVIRP